MITNGIRVSGYGVGFADRFRRADGEGNVAGGSKRGEIESSDEVEPESSDSGSESVSLQIVPSSSSPSERADSESQQADGKT